MKNLLKSKKLDLIIALCFLLLISFCVPSFPTAFAYSIKNKVLFVVADNYEKENLEMQCIENEFESDFYDVEIFSNLNMEKMNSYIAIALPYNLAKGTNICKCISTERIYLYGELTIKEYKEVTSINDFGLDVNINDANGNTYGTARQYLDESFEKINKFNVVCYGEVNTLLCSIEGEDIALFKYLYNVIDNFEIIIQSKMQRATILESKFDFTNDINSQRAYGVAHMDYTLYRNYNEEDVNYDYFGIRTKVWVTRRSSSSNVKEMKTKYELPNSNDNMLETGPASSENTGNLNVSIGFGQSGLNATIGFSIDLSSYVPNIVRTEDYTNDIVEWSLTEKTWSPKSINEATQDCVATWASLSSNATAAINIYFTGTVAVDTSLGNQRLVTGSYLQVPIRFAY